MSVVKFCDDLHGLSEKEAKEEIENNGYSHRVEKKDGNFFGLTHDYDPNRINLHIRNGEVTYAEPG